MSAQEDPERRSEELQKIRHNLQKQLDRCVATTRRQNFTVTYKAPSDLTRSEKVAMRRHIEAWHEDELMVTVVFPQALQSKKHAPTTTILINATRRQRHRRNQT